MQHILGLLAGGARNSTVMRGASLPEGGPIFLGKIAWGCQISWGAKFPVTLVHTNIHTYIHTYIRGDSGQHDYIVASLPTRQLN